MAPYSSEYWISKIYPDEKKLLSGADRSDLKRNDSYCWMEINIHNRSLKLSPKTVLDTNLQTTKWNQFLIFL